VVFRFIGKLLSGALALVMVVLPAVTHAQVQAEPKPFKTEELDQLLAPIALYPDELLTKVLMASTYPLEIVQASRWRRETANAKLARTALSKALEKKDWDPSVKALTQFPDVLRTMSEKLDWTQKLGDAFLAQQADVMDRIQFLRRKADEVGSLKSNKQQKVVKESSYIIIEAASPQTVYVPTYQPTVVYGPWWYPAYPPYYWSYGYPGSAFVSGFFWGAGVAIAGSLWDWGRCDWRRHDININVNKFNSINVNRTKITANTWRHDPAHRKAVPYRDKVTRETYSARDQVRREASRDFRGFEDKNQLRARPATTGQDRNAAQFDRRLPEKGKQAPKSLDSRAKPVSPPRPTSREGGGAFNVTRGADVQKQVERGRASRNVQSNRAAGARIQSGGGAKRRAR
jgi:hypothetical protein